ncbi:GNAT family N-acetyltransferase [Sinomonas gamaensis]|uniref:GNAT family N-acetyltransferase n=1 Tax=Sinomonas gamaensis TaxID=2565624 RepID=UPI001BB284D1|nr:hypothetical protein [Sinomonas gamaensis]
MPLNEFGQPRPLPDWAPRSAPKRVVLEGSFCRLEPLEADRHAYQLYSAYAQALDGRDWTYLSVGPFDSEEGYRQQAEKQSRSSDPLHFAVIDRRSGKAVGTLALMRHDPANGVVEVGHAGAATPLGTRSSTPSGRR